MKKVTRTEEDPGSRFMSGVSGSIVIGTGLVFFPPLALFAGLLMLGRNRSVKEVGKEMDSVEMLDTSYLAHSWKTNRKPGETSISISRTREAGGFLPMEVRRTHEFIDESFVEDFWKENRSNSNFR